MMAVESEDDAALILAALNDSTSSAPSSTVTLPLSTGSALGGSGATWRRTSLARRFVERIEARHSYDLRQPNALPWLFRIALNLVRDATVRERPRIAAYAGCKRWHGTGTPSEEDQVPRSAEARASSHGSLACSWPSPRKTWMPCSSMSGTD